MFNKSTKIAKITKTGFLVQTVILRDKGTLYKRTLKIKTMKLKTFLQDVVFFDFSADEYKNLPTEKEKTEYLNKVIKSINFHSRSSILLSKVAIVISILSICLIILKAMQPLIEK